MAQQQRRQARQAQQHVPSASDWEGANEAPADAADSGYGGSLLPAGWYDIEVAKSYFRTAQSSGLDYPNIECVIIEGEQTGRYAFCGLYINSPADQYRKGQKAFLAKWFEACGYEIPEAIPETDDDMSPLVGCKVSVQVIIEDNTDLQGNKVQANRIVRVRALGSDEEAADTPPPAQTQQRQPAQRQAAQTTRPAPARGSNGTQRTAAPARGATQQRRPSSINDMGDDIPF